jgi:hypothetical protein
MAGIILTSKWPLLPSLATRITRLNSVFIEEMTAYLKKL